MKSKREQELELEVKRLKQENETLKKTLKIQKKEAKEQYEIYEDLLKENKSVYYKQKYEIEKEKNEKLEKELNNKMDYIANVLGQMHKNSSNSSKPSSTDGLKKVIHNNKKESTKIFGGQVGHKYHEPKLISKPDKIIKIKKARKCECEGKIQYDGKVIIRQLIDLLTKYEVIEYQGKIGICNKCGKIHKPEFPEGINNQVQYGENVKGLSLILTERGNVPVEKTKELIGILTNSEGPSVGSIMYRKDKTYVTMKKTMKDIKEEILKATVLNHDETPLKIRGKFNYALGAFSKEISAIECYASRGQISFDEMNILSRYGGILVGDHYAVNEGFKGRVAYCNAHTIRAAKGVLDIRKRSKGKEYIKYMYELKEEVDKTTKNKLSKNRYEEVKKEYKRLLEEWEEEYNKFMKGKDKQYYKEERKLIALLKQYVDGHLMFAKESEVPFTNNEAERGLRPIKTKMKVIGGFRELVNADGYCNSISIVETCLKQKLNPCKILGKIANGTSKVFVFQNS